MKGQKLKFKAPDHLWQATGLLNDERGNSFRIFVYGRSKAGVHKFVQYLERKKAEGQPAIRVSVTRTKKYRGRKRGLEDQVASSSGEVEPGDADHIKLPGVSIGISRLKMVTRRPYTITYTIDPPIPLSEERTETDPMGEPVNVWTNVFEAEFSDLDEANILCEAKSGNVQVELCELDKAGNRIQRDVQDTVATSTAKLNQVSKTTGKWVVQVKGLDATNYFTLSWDKVVT
jgi:hypothetical protein